MFKYIWIIMLIIAFLIYIGYFIYCILDAYLSTMKYFENKNENLAVIIGEIFDEFILKHEDFVVRSLEALIIIGVVVFLMSLFSFLGLG